MSTTTTAERTRIPEVDNPPVTEEAQLVPHHYGGKSMLEKWVESGKAETALARVESMTRALEMLRAQAIKATYPTDWIIHTSVDADGRVLREVGYLQDCGAERAAKIWGIIVGPPVVEKEDFKDGTFVYHMTAEAWSNVTGERLEFVEGSRWSGDRFFQRQISGDDKVDPNDVRKSAWANLHGRAVRSLAGLGGVPVDVLRQAGLDIEKVVHVNYDKGAKGGESTGAQIGGAELTIPWGKAKGTKISELTDRDLDFYAGAIRKSVDDPAKERFKKANERLATALETERERRAQAKEHEAGENTANSRGARLGDLHHRLSDALGKKHLPKLSAFLAYLTAECGCESKRSIAELTDEDLEKLFAVPNETLTDYVQAFLDLQE